MSNLSTNRPSAPTAVNASSKLMAIDTVGENLLAFEILESKACCNKGQKADTADTLWESLLPNLN